MSTLDSTIEITIDLKEHLCSEGFPRVNFASLIERTKTPSNPENSNGALPLLSENQSEKIDISRQMDIAQSRKTYKGIREQDFYEVAQGYDSDDSFVDDSEAHEDLAPYEAKLEHGTFYVNVGKVVFSNIPHESSEDLSNFNSPSPKMETKSNKDYPDKLKSSSCIIEGDGYVITPPKKSSKKRKDTLKFSPKMVLKRSKSFKSQQQETETRSTFIPPVPIIEVEPQLIPNEKIIYNMPQQQQQQQQQSTEIPIQNTQPQKIKKLQLNPTKQTGKQLKSYAPLVDTNTLLLTKLSDANLLAQMDLTPECFTPVFYEKNDIHKFASQIPDSLASVLQLFFNHIQAKMSTPVNNLNSQENQFKRCLILGRVYAFLKRRQDLSLTQSIQNYLEHFFSIKFHSFDLILDTILKTIQSAFIYSPLETLISQIQPYIDRINDNSTDSQEDKQNPCKKRFKWSNGLKQLLGNAIVAQIELEKAGFGVYPENLSNEQIIIQFLTTFVLPCWPKGKMKVIKLYKVTQQFHEHFTNDRVIEIPQTHSNVTPQNKPITTTTTTVSPTNSNVMINYPQIKREILPNTITTQAKLIESNNEKLAKKHTHNSYGKIISPSSKLGSPKSLSSHPNLLNPELIPVASLMSITSLAGKKSPLIKRTPDMQKFREKSLKPKNDITIRKSPTVLPLPAFSCELDVKPVIQHSKRELMSTCLIPGQNVHPNLLLSTSNALFANNFTTPIPQTSEHIPSFNLINAPNFGQNFAFLQTYPETIIHLKPGSKETSPSNAKSHTPTP